MCAVRTAAGSPGVAGRTGADRTSGPAGARGTSLATGLLALAAAVAGGAFGWAVGGPPRLESLDEMIDHAADEAHLDPALLKAMVVTESGGRPGVESPRGAVGLLQLLPATAEEEARRRRLPWEGAASLTDPATNLRLGAFYFRRLLDRFGDEVFAVAAYNAGPTSLKRWRRRRPGSSPLDVVLLEGYDETRDHVLRVLALRDHYR